MPCAIGVRDDLGSYAARVAATACDDRARSNRACPPARLLLARGDVAAAARWTQEHGLSPEDKPGYPQELEYLVLARVLVALGRPGEARALLDRLGARAAAQDRTGSVVEIQALQALALAAGGDGPAAADTLAGALTLACQQGQVRVFADEGPPPRALLGRVVAALPSELGGTWVPRCRPRRFHPANTPSADALGGAGS